MQDANLGSLLIIAIIVTVAVVANTAEQNQKSLRRRE